VGIERRVGHREYGSKVSVRSASGLARENDSPNLLVIMTDQQSSWTISSYGATEIETPNIDRIAHEGLRLTDYFTNALAVSDIAVEDLPVSGERTHMTDWLTSRSVDFIDSRRDCPFFLTISIPYPHDPFFVRAPFDTMFDPKSLSVPETFCETDLPDWMGWPEVTNWHKPDRVVGNEENLRRAKAQYLGEVRCIDVNVGRIIDALEAAQLLDYTFDVKQTLLSLLGQSSAVQADTRRR